MHYTFPVIKPLDYGLHKMVVNSAGEVITKVKFR